MVLWDISVILALSPKRYCNRHNSHLLVDQLITALEGNFYVGTNQGLPRTGADAARHQFRGTQLSNPN